MMEEALALFDDRLGGPFLEGTAAAREATAEEVHPFCQRQREPAADQLLEVAIALDRERGQGLCPLVADGGGALLFSNHG